MWAVETKHHPNTMTIKQTAKFKNSESYRALLGKCYPYGLDDRNDAEWEVIKMVDLDLDTMRKSWDVAREAAGFNSDASQSAISNAHDTAAEGRFEVDSVAFFSCAIGSLNP